MTLPQILAILEDIKKKSVILIHPMPSANMKDRARKIYDLAKELQDDLKK